MDENGIIKSNRCNLDTGRPKDLAMCMKNRLLNRYCIVGISESVTQQAKKAHMDRPGHGTELYTARREYKGPNYGHGRFCGKFWYFAEKSGKLAVNSGIATGRCVSPTTGTRSQTTCYVLRGTGRVWLQFRQRFFYLTINA